MSGMRWWDVKEAGFHAIVDIPGRSHVPAWVMYRQHGEGWAWSVEIQTGVNVESLVFKREELKIQRQLSPDAYIEIVSGGIS